jgi:hypothetical protein
MSLISLFLYQSCRVLAQHNLIRELRVVHWLMLVHSCLFGHFHYTARIDGVATMSTRSGQQSQPLSNLYLKPSSS